MRIHYPKLRNMTHALSLSGFIASKGTYFIFLFSITAVGVVPIYVSLYIIHSPYYILLFVL